MPSRLAAALAGRVGDPATPGGAVDGDTWLARLPHLLDEVLRDWDLQPDSEPIAGTLALVLPVTTPEGEVAVVKLAWPHPSAAHEHLALRLWGDTHAVRLIRADPGRYVQLLERAGPDDLNSVSVEEACAVAGELLADLRAPARPPFAKLSHEAARWARDLRQAGEMDAAFPQRFRLQAASLAADLAADCHDSMVVHMDLHYSNVLASHRASGHASAAAAENEAGPGAPSGMTGRAAAGHGTSTWLATDPDPMLGELEACPAPLLWNRVDPADTGAALAWDTHNRIEIISDAAGLDPDRVRAWSLVRVVASALDEVRHPSGAPHRDLALRVRLAKALQPR